MGCHYIPTRKGVPSSGPWNGTGPRPVRNWATHRGSAGGQQGKLHSYAWPLPVTHHHLSSDSCQILHYGSGPFHYTPSCNNNQYQFSRSVVSDSLQPHGLQHTRPPCPSPTPRVYPNSCPLSQWCHTTLSSSVVPFSSCLQSFPASGSFPMSQLFVSGGQSIEVSASTSVLPMNT